MSKRTGVRSPNSERLMRQSQLKNAKYKFKSLSYTELDEDSVGHRLSESIGTFVSSINNLTNAYNDAKDKFNYINNRIIDLLHILQLGKGRLDARSNAKICKELVEARIYRAKIKREYTTLKVFMDNKDKLKPIKELKNSLDESIKVLGGNIYNSRSLTVSEIESLIDMPISDLGIVVPDIINIKGDVVNASNK